MDERKLRANRRLGTLADRFLIHFGAALNHEYFSSFDRYYFGWLRQPIGWVVCATIFSALVGFIIGPQGFVLMWSLIAFSAVGAIWPWLGMKGIRCELHFDAMNAEEQEPTNGRMVVVNNWPMPVFGITVEGDFLQDVFSDEDKVAFGLQRIPAWSRSEYQWELRPQRRGMFPVKPPVIGTGFPFGIYQSVRSVSVERQVVVWPKCAPLTTMQGVEGVNFNIAGALSDRSGQDGDVIGARLYREGDLLRQVHWAKSARTNRLVVLERQTAAQKTIRIIVDLTPGTHCGVGSQSTFEWSIRIAATLCKHLHQNQSLIKVNCIGIPNSLPNNAANSRGLRSIMDFLAVLPTLEDAAQFARDKTETRDAVRLPRILANEEVFWIGVQNSGASHRPPMNNRVHEILLGSQYQFSESRSREPTFTKSQLLVDPTHEPEEQIQLGWQRMCSDA